MQPVLGLGIFLVVRHPAFADSGYAGFLSVETNWWGFFELQTLKGAR